MLLQLVFSLEPIPTLVILAVFAACIPATESSNTMAFSGLLFNNCAAIKKTPLDLVLHLKHHSINDCIEVVNNSCFLQN
jgi:hypothetical protein